MQCYLFLYKFNTHSYDILATYWCRYEYFTYQVGECCRQVEGMQYYYSHWDFHISPYICLGRRTPPHLLTIQNTTNCLQQSQHKILRIFNQIQHTVHFGFQVSPFIQSIKHEQFLVICLHKLIK
jgi:hypothetical protein